MEGSVLNFLKAEWKMSNTGSAHWASSLKSPFYNEKVAWEDLSWEGIFSSMLLFQFIWNLAW